MCLDRIDPAVSGYFERNGRGEVIAYRYFAKSESGKLYSALYANTIMREESTWLTDSKGRISMSGDLSYPRGFHGFATAKVAVASTLSWQVVRRVLLRGTMTFGTQHRKPAVAASKVFICKGDLK